jgi:hypothetical protein
LCGIFRLIKAILISLIAQYNSWCWHDGHHQTLKRGMVNWNAELCGRIRQDLDDVLDKIEKRSDEILIELPVLYQRELGSLFEMMAGIVLSHLLRVSRSTNNL